MIDATAVASVVGVETTFKSMNAGGAQILPQRIAVLAQGSSDAVYSTTKWVATSAGAAGQRFGFGSPIHLALLQLLPANGDGVGTIPVTVYPLVDNNSSQPSTGSIVPSGTATKTGAYRVRISGVLSAEFVLPAGAISLNTALAAIGTAINATLEMPMKVGYTYGSPSAGAISGTGNGTLSALSVTGTPTPGVWTLKCVTAVVNGGVWSLTDPNGTLVSSSLTMTPGAGGATVLSAGGLQFTLTDGSTDFGVGATFLITVPATNLTLTSKWKGLSANDLYIEILGDTSLGVVFTVTQPSGGLVNASVTSALQQVGNVWETLVLNAQNIEDTTLLDQIQTWGEGRWNKLVRKPCIAFTGNTKPDLASATAVCSVRSTDKINAQLVAPGSVNLPLVVAARQLARIAAMANNNPATGYNALRATGLLPGTDGVQWDYTVRDLAVKAGSSTAEVKDGVLNLGDIVTFYRPTGEEPPAYRYVVTIIKLMQCIFNLDLIFASQEWAAAPLIPDDQPTVNPNARKPKSAKAQAAAMIDVLALNAILSDPATAKKKTTASINASNPNRLDLKVPVQVSGNTNIKSVDLEFGFFFGAAA